MPLVLFAAGSNAVGQLGNGSAEDSNSFTPCQFLPDDPMTSPAAPASPRPGLPRGTKDVVSVVSGANHTLVLLRQEDGTLQVYACGDNSKGQLGLPKRIPAVRRFVRVITDVERDGQYEVVAIAAAWETSYFVLRHRSTSVSGQTVADVLISVGSNDSGDLGVVPLETPLVQSSRKGKEKAKDAGTDSEQHVIKFDHLLPDDDPPYRIAAITTGVHHVIVLLELQESSEAESTTARQIIAGWGTHRHGQLGIPCPCAPFKPAAAKTKATTLPFLSIPTLLPFPSLDGRNVTQLSAGSQHSLVLDASGSVTGWGTNRKGQLETIEKAAKVTNAQCTWNGSYLVSEDSSGWKILSTGSGEKGQLGRVELSSSASPNGARPPLSSALLPVDLPFDCSTRKLVKLACGSEHILALCAAETGSRTELWGWGWNEHGNLGVGHHKDVYTPTKVELEDPGLSGSVDAWAGCGTSWVAAQSLGV